MRLKTPRSTRRNRLPHAAVRGRSGLKREAHLSRAICEASTSKASHAAAVKCNRRQFERTARDAAIKARAEAKAKAPPRPVFESMPPAPNEQPRSSYDGPGSKWHRRMVAAGRKG